MIPKSKETVGFFAGSFNPFTIGHASLVERGLGLFNRIIIGVGINESKGMQDEVNIRVKHIAELYKQEPRVSVVSYSSLTTDAASQNGATHLLRGIRSVADFEYEKNIADLNRKISGFETVLLFTTPEMACVSSSAVRELEHFGMDVSEFLPDNQ